MADPTQHHDALFKKTFSEVEHAAAEFRAVLPPPLVALTDFSTLALSPGRGGLWQRSELERQELPQGCLTIATQTDVDRWLEFVLSADTLEAVLDH